MASKHTRAKHHGKKAADGTQRPTRSSKRRRGAREGDTTAGPDQTADRSVTGAKARQRTTRTDPPHGLRPPTARDIAEVLAAPHPGALLFTRNEWGLVTEAVKLSPRERQVAWMLVLGHSRKMIAHHFRNHSGQSLHVGTIDRYVARLFAKLQARTGHEILSRLLALRRRIRRRRTPQTM